eukprot:TRINITY_DN43110_c1_g1_i2.p1 TRINITY_DN43110_c1_g1~~TRINITY_DN43110_c1_g1_i2.p1  ORF type:complete len:262 (-),score=33.19 TRINITY_DN43110_c1_g1_i2:72-857(-)
MVIGKHRHCGKSVILKLLEENADIGSVVYLSTLELMKSVASSTLESYPVVGQAPAAALGSFVGGAVASLSSQMVVVPIDVISQRQMMLGTGKQGGVHMSGVDMARQIVRKEGLGGLYRGFSMSIMTYIPSSAIWWSSYGGFQKLLWQRYDGENTQQIQDKKSNNGHTLGEVVVVQVLSAGFAGATAGICTTPLDVIKTRLQIKEKALGSSTPTITGTVRELLAQYGVRGFFRGVIPRVANTMLWGTCMVTTYEFLKRLCVL